jgi:hypothetical protein
MNHLTFKANLNLKTIPNELVVHGSIITYGSDDEVTIAPAYPGGINPTILLLDLKIKEGKGPKKGTPKAFSLIMNEDSIKNYSKVTIQLEDGESQTEDVKIFG